MSPSLHVMRPLVGPSGRCPLAVAVDLVRGPHVWHGDGGGNYQKPVTTIRETSITADTKLSSLFHGFELFKIDRYLRLPHYLAQ